MKISIDTTTDSKEEIRKAIRLLQALVEHDPSQGSRNIFDSPGADLFSSNPTPTPAEPNANPVAAFGNLFNDDRPVQQSAPEDKKKDDIPQIELY